MIKFYTVKSNARRDAAKKGLSKDLVKQVGDKFVIGEPDAVETQAAPEPEPVKEAPAPAAEPPIAVVATKKPRKPKAPVASPATRKESVESADTSTAAKRSQLETALRSGWTSAAQLQANFGWQAHTLRGAISTFAKKAQVTIERDKRDGVNWYRVAGIEG